MKGNIGSQLKGILLSTVLIFVLSLPLQSRTNSHFTASGSIHESQETIVYITKTRTKYHKSSCRYLSQSKIQTTLKKAMSAGNEAFKVCKP